MKVVKSSVKSVLTTRQRLYAEARELGLTQKAAAIKAGCPEKSAEAAGCRLEKHANVIEHRARLVAAKESPSQLHAENLTTDPLSWLETFIANPLKDDKLKVQVALGLLPYKHKKLGDQGKKDQQQEQALVVARGRGRAALTVVK